MGPFAFVPGYPCLKQRKTMPTQIKTLPSIADHGAKAFATVEVDEYPEQ
jgi:hypothetical protein